MDEENKAEAPLLEGAVNLSFIAGVIPAKDQPNMERQIFRQTRGNALTYFDQFENAAGMRAAYLVVFQNGAVIQEKLQKICDGYSGTRFEVPPLNELPAQVALYEEKSRDHDRMLRQTQLQLKKFLRDINKIQEDNGAEASASTLEVYQWFVSKEKAIFNAINMMRPLGSTYQGFIWVPIEFEAEVQAALSEYASTEFGVW